MIFLERRRKRLSPKSQSTKEKIEEEPDKSEYQKLQFRKKQKLIERAKSLSDISRLQNGYSPIKHSFDSFDSTSVNQVKFCYILFELIISKAQLN